MCFSAPGSFILGTALIGSGIYNVSQAKNGNHLFLAATPMLFGIQQIAEGGVWLAINAGNQLWLTIYSLGFLFFSVFFWPLWIPLSSYQFEAPGWRKEIIKYFFWAGTIYGSAWYLAMLINCPTLHPIIIKHSIAYESFVASMDPGFLAASYLIYAVIVIGGLIFSSAFLIRLLALLLSITVAVAGVFFYYAFSSVWCFMAAILSLYLLWVIKIYGKEAAKI